MAFALRSGADTFETEDGTLWNEIMAARLIEVHDIDAGARKLQQRLAARRDWCRDGNHGGWLRLAVALGGDGGDSRIHASSVDEPPRRVQHQCDVPTTRAECRASP